MQASRDIARLLEIMAALRTPGTGCPWDLEQDFATIAPYTLEEAYEVADAIARGDLGDLARGTGRPPAPGRVSRPHGAGARRLRFRRRGGRRSPKSCCAVIPHVFGEARDLAPDEVESSGTASRPRKRPRSPNAGRRRRGRRAGRGAGRRCPPSLAR